MRPLSVALVLLSALSHLYWNYQAKKSPAPAAFTFWLMGMGAVLAAPFGLTFSTHQAISPIGWACVGGTGLLYAAYYFLLARGYHHDDLSRVYPIARGVAPAATAVWGVLFYREHPSLAGWLGITAVSGGVLLLCGPPGWPKKRGAPLPMAGILAAIGTGLCTSGYSAVDKLGVRHVDPALYLALTFAAGALAQGAILWQRGGPQPLLTELRRAGATVWLAAAASAGGYLLILLVLKSEPISYVVPLRSTAVLLSVVAGSRLLGEEGGPMRLASAVLIVMGICAIALGG